MARKNRDRDRVVGAAVSSAPQEVSTSPTDPADTEWVPSVEWLAGDKGFPIVTDVSATELPDLEQPKGLSTQTALVSGLVAQLKDEDADSPEELAALQKLRNRYTAPASTTPLPTESVPQAQLQETQRLMDELVAAQQENDHLRAEAKELRSTLEISELETKRAREQIADVVGKLDEANRQLVDANIELGQLRDLRIRYLALNEAKIYTVTPTYKPNRPDRTRIYVIAGSAHQAMLKVVATGILPEDEIANVDTAASRIII